MKTVDYKKVFYKGFEHHLIRLENGAYVTYENILKNSKKIDLWGTFIIKKFDSEGKPLIDYISVSKDIFRAKEVIPLTLKLNPEFLV